MIKKIIEIRDIVVRYTVDIEEAVTILRDRISALDDFEVMDGPELPLL